MQPPQWSGMRGHLLLSTISTLSGSPSVHEPRKQGLEASCSTTFCLSSSTLALLRCSSRTRWVQGVLAHTGVISLRGLTFKLGYYLPEATAANGTWGIQIRLKRDQSDKEGFAIYQAFTSRTLKVGFVMMLASDWGSVFTNYASSERIYVQRMKVREGWSEKDKMQLWQEQEEKEECSGFFNPIVRQHYCNLPQDHGHAQPQA